jgi:hypothetical protein
MKYGEIWPSQTAASITTALENAAEALHVAACSAEVTLDVYTNNWENAWIDLGGEG